LFKGNIFLLEVCIKTYQIIYIIKSKKIISQIEKQNLQTKIDPLKKLYIVILNEPFEATKFKNCIQ